MPKVQELHTPETLNTALELGKEIASLRGDIESSLDAPSEIKSEDDADRFASLIKLGFDKKALEVFDTKDQKSAISALKSVNTCRGLEIASVHGHPEYAKSVISAALESEQADFSNEPTQVYENTALLLGSTIKDEKSLETALNNLETLKDRGMDVRYMDHAIRSAIEYNPEIETIQRVFEILKDVNLLDFEDLEDRNVQKRWVSFLKKACKVGGSEQVSEYLSEHFRPEDMGLFGDYESHGMFRDYIFETMSPAEVTTFIQTNVEKLINKVKSKEVQPEQLSAAVAWFTTIQWLYVSDPESYKDTFDKEVQSLSSFFLENAHFFEKIESETEFDSANETVAYTLLIYNNRHYEMMSQLHPDNRREILKSFDLAFSLSEDDLIRIFGTIEKVSDPKSTHERVIEGAASAQRLHSEYESDLANVVGLDTAENLKNKIDEVINSLHVEEVYFLRKFIERYGLMSDEVINLLTRPDKTQKLEINKSGAKLEIFVGGNAHGVIKRTQKAACNAVWEEAAGLSPFAGDGDEPPIPVEPIIKKSKAASALPEGMEVIYTRFCGLTIPRMRGVLSELVQKDIDNMEKAQMLDQILESEKQRIRKTLLEAGIDHGHAHPENFTVEFVRNSYLINESEDGEKNINTELDYDEENVTFDPQKWMEEPDEWKVVVRLIDFDRAKKK